MTPTWIYFPAYFIKTYEMQYLYQKKEFSFIELFKNRFTFAVICSLLMNKVPNPMDKGSGLNGVV